MKVAFMPPIADIGPYPQYIQLILSVTNQLGKTVSGICLNITVLPVDNQPPQVKKAFFSSLFLYWMWLILCGFVKKSKHFLFQVASSPLTVDEGGESRLSLENLLMSDVDSEEEALRVQLQREPHHGALWLGNLLKPGHVFTVKDLRSLKVRSDALLHSFLCLGWIFLP